jgi:GNAT superfamily N-acetyltransferase
MSCSASIRACREEDAERLANLYVRTFRDAFAGVMPKEFVDPVGELERAAKLRPAIATGASSWLIALAENELVGCCCLAVARDSDLPADFGEIIVIAVAPLHRRHGHGLALLNAARAEALDRAWHGLVLWVVAANTDARAFYAHADFIPDGSAKVDDRLGFATPLIRYRTSINEPR